MSEKSEGTGEEEEDSQVQADARHVGKLGIGDIWKTNVTAETSPGPEGRKPQAHPGRCQAQAWLGKAHRQASSASGEAGEGLQAEGGKILPSRGSILGFCELCPF